jgi:hypothetical protein
MHDQNPNGDSPMTTYEEARKDAGSYREWIALKFGPLFCTRIGSEDQWDSADWHCAELAKMIGSSTRRVSLQAQRDYEQAK